MKADDDIVYIHMSSFQAFVERVWNLNGSNVHFPNIINNDVGFVVQYDRVTYGASELRKWMAISSTSSTSSTTSTMSLNFHLCHRSRHGRMVSILKVTFVMTCTKYSFAILPDILINCI